MGNDNLAIFIIDNEQQSLQQIVDIFLSDPAISEVITVSDTNEAILKLISTAPDVILIRYPLTGNTEKEFFELIKSKHSGAYLTFVCSTKNFAKKAIQYGIYNYILKPVSEKTIKELIISAFEKKQSNIANRLDQVINSNSVEARLRFATAKGFIIFSPDELLFCKSVGYYSELYLTNNRIEISHLSLMRFEEKMTPYGFIRISRTYLINPKYLRRIFKKGNLVTLSFDGKEYEIKAGKDQLKKLDTFDVD